jgi:hypothetical protein
MRSTLTRLPKISRGRFGVFGVTLSTAAFLRLLPLATITEPDILLNCYSGSGKGGVRVTGVDVGGCPGLK